MIRKDSLSFLYVVRSFSLPQHSLHLKLLNLEMQQRHFPWLSYHLSELFFAVALMSVLLKCSSHFCLMIFGKWEQASEVEDDNRL